MLPQGYLAPFRSCKSHLLTGIILLTGGCWTDLDDPAPAGGTGNACPQGTMCNGVQVWCSNNEEDNYWWKQIPLQSTPGCGATDEHCCVNDQCWQKVYSLDAPPFNDAHMGPICVGLDWPGPVHPLLDWQSHAEDSGGPPGGYPVIDDEIREVCSARCENAGDKWKPVNIQPALANECEDMSWTGHQTYTSWIPDHGYNCVVTMMLNADDPDGSQVPWDLVGGPSTPVPLYCDLDDDCAALFYPGVAEFILTPGTADIIDPETRLAHYLGVEGTGSELTLTPAWGSPDTEPLFGMAEYTAIGCQGPTGGPADVCPFYLANLSAFNTSSSWTVVIETTSGRQTKDISNVQVDLLQSTLGIHHKGLDKVAFAPGALPLRVEFDVDTASGAAGTKGNGTHVFAIENDDYVFADYDDGELTVSHTFPFQSGDATLSITVVPDEHPPTAAHDVAAVEECDVYQGSPYGGLLLDQNRSFSTDPDNDIVEEAWWVDGAPCGHGCVVPVGSHAVSLQAHDARGAIHRTPDHWVYVEIGDACIETFGG